MIQNLYAKNEHLIQVLLAPRSIPASTNSHPVRPLSASFDAPRSLVILLRVFIVRYFITNGTGSPELLTCKPAGARTIASPVLYQKLGQSSMKTRLAVWHTFSWTMRKNASSEDRSAGTCFLMWANHAGEANRWRIATEQSSRTTAGIMVGSAYMHELPVEYLQR